MFTFIGILFIIAGFGLAGLILAEIVQELPFDVPVTENTLLLILVGIGFLGVIFLIMGRRPAN